MPSRAAPDADWDVIVHEWLLQVAEALQTALDEIWQWLLQIAQAVLTFVIEIAAYIGSGMTSIGNRMALCYRIVVENFSEILHIIFLCLKIAALVGVISIVVLVIFSPVILSAFWMVPVQRNSVDAERRGLLSGNRRPSPYTYGPPESGPSRSPLTGSARPAPSIKAPTSPPAYSAI